MGDAGAPQADLTGLVMATIEKLRTKLLDLSLSNPLLKIKPSEKTKTHILIFDEIPEMLFAKLVVGKELEFAWIEEPDVEPADEHTDRSRTRPECRRDSRPRPGDQDPRAGSP